jgi:hypothetical protein
MGEVIWALGWVQSIMGMIVPWWAYAVAGVAAGIAAFILIPPAVPTSLRQLAAMALISIGVCISAYSMGRHFGEDHEREVWTRRIEAEKARLAEGFTDQLTKEQRRAQEAEQASADLRKELERISASADKVDKPDDIVVPEHIARSLSDLRPRYKRDRR